MKAKKTGMIGDPFDPTIKTRLDGQTSQQVDGSRSYEIPDREMGQAIYDRIDDDGTEDAVSLESVEEVASEDPFSQE